VREIKFRVWDRIKKEFELIDSLYELQKMNLSDAEFLNKDFLQFTGLKDAHGRNIFEGDIIEYDNEEGIVRAVVEFSTDNDDQPFLSAFVPIPILVRDYIFPNNPEDPITLTVIGNIYENPELLINKGKLK
jgi:hypothetical protein